MCAPWTHVRRKFYDAIPENPAAEVIVEKMNELFSVEHEAKSLDEVLEVRKKKSPEILATIDALVTKQVEKSLKKSAMGKAIQYYQAQLPNLTHFLNDPHIPLSNNAAERALRTPVLGRKNFQGFRTINGADVGMICYTIVNTCKLLQLLPKAYLMDMAMRVHQGDKLITPYQYGKELQAKAQQSLDPLFEQAACDG